MDVEPDCSTILFVMNIIYNY